MLGGIGLNFASFFLFAGQGSLTVWNRLSGVNFFADILPLIFSLIAIVAVLYLCYLFSKFIAKKVNHISDSNNIKILERVALAQDKGLAIAEICGKFYLIGFANNNIEILQELEEQEMKLQQTPEKYNFMEILNATMKNRWEVKKVDSTKSDTADHAESGEEQKEQGK